MSKLSECEKGYRRWITDPLRPKTKQQRRIEHLIDVVRERDEIIEKIRRRNPKVTFPAK